MAGGKRKDKDVTGRLTLAARALRTATAARLAEIDLYPGQEAVLLAIEAEDGISLRELAARLAVRPPTVTKTIARMSAQGLVEKKPAPGDARQTHAFLTATGLALVEGVRAARKSVQKTALKGLTEKERKTLRKLLARVEKNLSKPDGPQPVTDED